MAKLQHRQMINKRTLTFVAVLYSEGGLGWFVVSHVAQSFTFPCGLVFDDHTILNVTMFLQETQVDRSKAVVSHLT